MRRNSTRSKQNNNNVKKNRLEDHHEDLFLPEKLVKLVLKIAKIFELTSYDEFSLLDTLQYAVVKKSLEVEKHWDERDMLLMLVNVVRMTEKFNRSSSALAKLKMCQVFPNLGITDEQFNKEELNVFKLIEFRVVEPIVVQMIYKLIDSHLSQHKKIFLFEFSMDILRFVYAFRSNIYQVFTKTSVGVDARKLCKDHKLLASAVLLVVLRIEQVPDRFHNQCFDVFVSEIDKEQADKAASNLNQLSAIIFDFIKVWKR